MFISLIIKFMIVPKGFEPPSPGPKPGKIDHYSTELRCFCFGFTPNFLSPDVSELRGNSMPKYTRLTSSLSFGFILIIESTHYDFERTGRDSNSCARI